MHPLGEQVIPSGQTVPASHGSRQSAVCPLAM